MKYVLHINQEKALKLGITHINQGLILDFLTTVGTWAEPMDVEGETYFWVARQKIADELPLLNLKPDTVYRHLKKLSEIELIDYVKVGKKDCLRISEKGQKYVSSTMSETNPNHYVGNESELPQNSDSNPKKLGNKSEKHSDLNPTYTTTKLNTTTKDITNIPPNPPDGGNGCAGDKPDQTRPDDKPPKVTPIPFDDFWEKYPRKQNRSQAEKAWIKLKPDKKLFDQIVLNIDQRLKLGEWSIDDKQHIPHGATYLNQERWQDEVIADKQDGQSYEERTGFTGIFM